MHARATLALATALGCVLVVGCGTDREASTRHSAGTTPGPSASTRPRTPESTTTPSTTPSTTPTTTAAPISRREARRRWHDAIYATGEELTGRYLWSAWGLGSDKPVVEEHGVFGLAPMRTAFERIYREPTSGDEDPTEYTLRVRRRGEAMYMQMSDWGPWDGCWLHVTPELVAQTTQFELPDSPALPMPLVVTLDAVVTGSSDGSVFVDPYVELRARVSAIEVMQLLGVSAGALAQDQDRLTRVQVPIVVAIGVDDRVKGAAAWGDDVVAALKRAHVRLRPELRQALPGLSASVEFGTFGKGAEVRFPAPRFVLPPGATKQRTCPAKTPLS
jgi:hypothetical protein